MWYNGNTKEVGKFMSKYIKSENVKFKVSHVAYALIAAVAASASLTANATAIDPTAYERSFTITFPGYSGSETLTDFPVLVKISAERNDFDYSACKVANGGDLRFAASDGTLLASEVDTWNPEGESLVWVKVPSLNKATVITAYYGNATPDPVTASEVWANGYVAVWHLNEASTPLADSSGKATPFVVPPSTADRTTYATNGVVGGKSVSFDNERYGDANYARLVADDDPDLRGLTNFTVECWTYQTKYNDGDASIIGTWTNWKLYQEKNSGILASRWLKANGDKVFGAKTTSGLALNEWTHLTLVRNFTGASSANSALYLNGGSVVTKSESNAEPTGSGNVVTNVLGGGDGIRVFPGSIDEVRVSNVARSADWVRASHDCVMEEGFASFGVEEGDNDWTKYSHRFRMSFSGYAGSETLANFPVLVKISESGISGFRYADCKKPGGADLRFADANGNLLASEVDTWDETGTSLVWVKVPSLTASTRITAYYGWDFAPVVDSSAVWTGNGYVGVWHLNEAATPLADSSGKATPFLLPASTQDRTTYATNGVAGGKSVSFDNEHYNAWNPRLEAADDPDLRGLTNFTVECWTYQTRYRNDDGQATIIGSSNNWKLYQESNGNLDSRWKKSDGTSNVFGPKTTSGLPLNEWTHSTVVRNFTGESSANSILYLNGGSVATYTESSGATQTGNGSAVAQSLGAGDGIRVFPGSIDEVRVSNVARSADWVKASHDTVNGSSFAKYGPARENVATGMMIIFR